MQGEESLVQRAVEGNHEAFTRLYEEHFDRIYRYIAFKIGDRVEAEDMTQQVFLNAVKSISSFKWKGVTFSSWLYRIAHNQMVDHLRKKDRQPSVELVDPVVSNEASPQQVAEQKMDIERVLKATKGLTEAQQEVISLRFSGGLSIAEVAGIMGKSQGAVKALQHSAILALRKVLSAGDENEATERI